MRRQYLALKRQHPDAILFFRLGDFYETFDADAELTARVLHITLTSREVGKGQRVPMAGVPYHAAESYIARLIAAGYKVAICEQLDPTPRIGSAGRFAADHALDASPAGRGMMARQVVRVVTPGTVVEPRMLEARRNNYLCAIVAAYGPGGLPQYGLAHADLTTGEFAATELTGDEAGAELARELDRLQPAECLIPATRDPHAPAGGAEPGASLEAAAAAGRTITPFDAWRFELGTAQELLCRQFGVTSLAGFGCAHLPLATRAAGALVAYVEQTHRPLLALLDGLRTYEPGAYMRLDGFTRRNLELFAEGPGRRAERTENGSPAARPTLLSVIDETRTPMGGRLLRRWLGQPLLDLDAINARLDAVEALVADGVLRARVRAALDRIADIERLTNRARQGTAHPRDLLALRASLLAAAEIRGLADGGEEERSPSGDGGGGEGGGTAFRLHRLLRGIDPCLDVADLIERAVYDPSAPDGSGPGKNGRRAVLGTWEEERLIRPGYSQELDELVRSSADARQWIAGLEAAERERTGIKSLKVGFNKVFGYYLQVSHAYKGEVPAHYIRRQTLTDGERYITPELKEYENLVLHAQERIAELERALFADLQRQLAAQAGRLLAAAEGLAQLDVLAGFAEVAVRRGYVRPLLDESEEIEIVQGRHPVVEAALDAATAQVGQPAAFVPNDCRLSTTDDQIIILTGPNMAGKSTYLRAVALIVLLAQAGSFVPAQSARVGLVDRIFTRVGAQDDLAAGQSTFMVEMVETATILRHATRRSLVVLDEIGRGTSTYDGVAIAQAVVEYLHGDWTKGKDEGRRTDAHQEGAFASSSAGHPSSGSSGPGGPRTLFATHYHELAELERALPRVRNYRMDVLEEGERVVFLHRVVRGNADRSYGIHVARLAGVPRQITQRAAEVLHSLERRRAGALPPTPPTCTDGCLPAASGPAGAGALGPANGRLPSREPPGVEAGHGRAMPWAAAEDRPRQHPIEQRKPETGRPAPAVQLALFTVTDPLVEELKAIDVMRLTPLEALNRLAALVEQARQRTG